MGSDLFLLSINGHKIECRRGQTILEVACEAGIEIPHFCYHPGLQTKGFCHVCFVNVNGKKDLELACASLVQEGMEILTYGDNIEEAHKGVLDLLVQDHPLECPVCERAGECNLQDLTFLYGPKTFSNTLFTKNNLPLKNFNPLLQGNMNRCIECHRCISFLEDVAGTGELGFFHTTKGCVIDTCLESGVTSELSGNLLDVCPSGAIIENIPVVQHRWETEKRVSIDVMDAMGSAVRLDCREEKVVRILPVEKESINQYWSTDKIRFSYDGLSNQRLAQPYIRKNGVLEPASWIDAFKTLVRKISELEPSEMAFLVGDLVEVDSAYLLRQLLDDMKIYNRDCCVDGAFLPTHDREDYLFNTSFERIEKSDACLVIGSDIRYDAPLLNVRLRQRYKTLGSSLGVIGEKQDLTFGYEYLGSSASILNEIADGTHPFCDRLRQAKTPMMIVGMDALSSSEGEAIYNTSRFIAQCYSFIRDDWNGFNVLHRAAGRVGALDVGFVPRDQGHGVAGILRMAKARQLKLLYLMGVDEIPLQGLESTFVVYQGHHGDAGAQAADLVLPGAAFSEKNGFYVNAEGRAQFVSRAVFPPGEAKEDWKIIRGLSEVLGYKLPYETYEDVYEAIRNYSEAFRNLNFIVPPKPFQRQYDFTPINQGALLKEKQNYYFTNPICRASSLMAQRATPSFLSKKEEKR
jgi:NADH-quinone oxidoreductase subunit G